MTWFLPGWPKESEAHSVHSHFSAFTYRFIAASPLQCSNPGIILQDIMCTHTHTWMPSLTACVKSATVKSADSCAAHQNRSGMLGMCVLPRELGEKEQCHFLWHGLVPVHHQQCLDQEEVGRKLFLSPHTDSQVSHLAGVLFYSLVELYTLKHTHLLHYSAGSCIAGPNHWPCRVTAPHTWAARAFL